VAIDDIDQARFEKLLEDAAITDRQQWSVLDLIMVLLESAGIANDGHKRLISLIKRNLPASRRILLAPYQDKYSIEGSDVDCAARLHLCHAKCCTLPVELSAEDLKERELEWEIDDPYVLRRGSGSYCAYIDTKTGGCTTYHNRPAICRQYDCRDDKRIWKDFEAMIPADMPVDALEFPAPEAVPEPDPE
jgi:Fe-S-cluster containining protein